MKMEKTKYIKLFESELESMSVQDFIVHGILNTYNITLDEFNEIQKIYAAFKYDDAPVFNGYGFDEIKKNTYNHILSKFFDFCLYRYPEKRGTGQHKFNMNELSDLYPNHLYVKEHPHGFELVDSSGNLLHYKDFKKPILEYNDIIELLQYLFKRNLDKAEDRVKNTKKFGWSESEYLYCIRDTVLDFIVKLKITIPGIDIKPFIDIMVRHKSIISIIETFHNIDYEWKKELYKPYIDMVINHDYLKGRYNLDSFFERQKKFGGQEEIDL